MIAAMALSDFKTGYLRQDRHADVSAIQLLRRSLADIRSEMEGERNVLRDRFDTLAGDAAFSQQLLENEPGSLGLASKVRRLTGTMIEQSGRITLLQAQIDFVADLERRADRFLEGNPLA